MTGSLMLLQLNDASREDEIHWINNRIRENSAESVRTVFLTLYDLITVKDVPLGNMDAYIVRMIPGARNSGKLFDERVISVNDDISKLDLILSDVTDYRMEHGLVCEIILYSLSHLIHMHGWRRIYSFITTKIPEIKRTQTNLICFYYPESHEKRSEIAVFERLADKVRVEQV